MRLLTHNEWNDLIKITSDVDYLGHLSWVRDDDYAEDFKVQIVCGGLDLDYYELLNRRVREYYTGFRPAFDNPNPDLPDGSIVVVGTLYMNGNPVKVMDTYVPGATLELRPALQDPDYQIQAYKVGNVLIAARNVLESISYDDILAALEV